ncbi:MAG: hypothetical protein HY823_12125 [Acidobacteria bacterium]|nr:hypothetical protein [Acidobacteriota bacterium]
MAPDPFASLPDDSRLWVLALAEAALPAQAEALRAGLGSVLGGWRHKGQAYQAAWEFREARLLLVAEASMAQEPSGCAIDGMLRRVRGLLEGLDLRPLPEDHLLLRTGDILTALPRADLGAWLEAGRISGATPLLDLGLTHLGQLRGGRLERPLAATWAGRKYGLHAAS